MRHPGPLSTARIVVACVVALSIAGSALGGTGHSHGHASFHASFGWLVAVVILGFVLLCLVRRRR